MKVTKKKFPAKIYVARANPGTKDEYLTCSESFSELAEKDEVIEAAVYELTEVGQLTALANLGNLRVVK